MMEKFSFFPPTPLILTAAGEIKEWDAWLWKAEVAVQLALCIHWFHAGGFSNLLVENILKKKFHKVQKSKTWTCCSQPSIYIAFILYLLLFTLLLHCVKVAVVIKYPSGDSRDAGLILGLGSWSGGGNGNPLQYSFLENLRDRSLAGYNPYRVAESHTWLSS